MLMANGGGMIMMPGRKQYGLLCNPSGGKIYTAVGPGVVAVIEKLLRTERRQRFITVCDRLWVESISITRRFDGILAGGLVQLRRRSEKLMRKSKNGYEFINQTRITAVILAAAGGGSLLALYYNNSANHAPASLVGADDQWNRFFKSFVQEEN